MQRSDIENLYNKGRLLNALEALNGCNSSPWSDTLKLKCLRTVQGKQALRFAQRLHDQILDKSAPYSLTTSERNNQFRLIALVYAEQGDAKLACLILKPLCQQSPDVASLFREYAFALINDGQLDLAEKNVNHAIDLQPRNAKAHAQLARIYCLTGRLESGRHSYSRAATLEPNNTSYLQRLVYWNNFSDQATQQNTFQMAKLWAKKAYPGNQASTNNFSTVDPDRVLKLGFISPDFCAHAMNFFITPLLEGLDRKRFHITGYSDTRKPDMVTEKIKRLCDAWVDSAQQKDSQLSAQIINDKIDVLIDLNGHATGNRLGVFAHNESPAPIQMSWLGAPSTSGLKSIAFRITDRIADPGGINEEYFTEKLLRLPNGFLCFKPLTSSPDIAPSDGKGVVRFGSFSNLAKISNITLDCWAAALHAVPNSTLFVKRQQLINKQARRHFANELAARGIAAERLIFKASKAKIEDHLAEYNNIDIALDTTPYNGTTTTLEALWMGVPVISLAGETRASRVTTSILHRLNLSGMSATTVNEFAKRAAELSEMPDTLTMLRSKLRDRMRESSLMNYKQFAFEFGDTIRSQWHDWCQQSQIRLPSEADKKDDLVSLDGIDQ